MSRLHRFFHTRLNLLAAAALLAVLAGQLGSLWWPLELFSHFLPHYAAVFLLAAGICRGRGRIVWAACGSAALVWLSANGLTGKRTTELPRNAQTVVWHNVHLHHPDPAALIGQILRTQADVAVLAEINASDARWQPLQRHYPHGCIHADHSPFALAVFSQRALHACEIRWSGDYPYIRAVLADGTVLYALHPTPPINADLAAARQQYLAVSAQAIAAEARVLAVGDLNSSPFSPLFRRFYREAGLAPHNPYWLPTWRPVGLNIDHALSRGLGPVSVRGLEALGSDHRALAVRFAPAALQYSHLK